MVGNDAMTPLSPAAQAVLDAVVAASPRLQSKGVSYGKSTLIAAALRAVADQVVPRTNVSEDAPTREITRSVQRLEIRAQLLDIARELENNA